MPKSTPPADDFVAGSLVPESGPAEVQAGEQILLDDGFALGDDGEAGVLAAAEQANYEQAQADYQPIAEGE